MCAAEAASRAAVAVMTVRDPDPEAVEVAGCAMEAVAVAIAFGAKEDATFMDEREEVEDEADGEVEDTAELKVVEGEEAEETAINGPPSTGPVAVNNVVLAAGSAVLAVVVVVAVVARAFCNPLCADTTAPEEAAAAPNRSLGRLSSGVGVNVPVMEMAGEPRLTAAVPGLAETEVVVTVGGKGDPTKGAGLVTLRQRS